ncbi:MAG: dTDP-4-dehydrorhamnose reductase [Hyphomicrobium sp.]|nr:dTDP-4-dehydrorhamnose reductase [Hyphomicrobium sp.]
MRLLVTGRNGQLALCLAELAAARGADLLAFGRPELDISDPRSVENALEAHSPDLVINAAAYTAVDKAEGEPGEAQRVNALGAANVARAAAGRGLPLVHISTDYVFDGTKPAPYVETDATGPIGVYGRSKLEGEDAVRASGGRHVILRTAWVYSPFGNNFLKTMLRLAATRPELTVVDDQIGNPTYAPDLARAILDIAPRLISDDNMPWGTFHAAGTGDVSWCGFAREIVRCSTARGGPSADVRAIQTKDYPTPARRPANSRLDTTKLKSTFGITLPCWQEGVEDCVARLLPPS